MHYVYALVFVLLVSPLETIVRWFDGVLMNNWVPFYEAISTGALFAYSAILNCDTLIRASLLPISVQQQCHLECKIVYIGSFSLSFISILLFVLLFARHSEHLNWYAHLIAAIIAFFTLILTFLAIWIDDQGRMGIDNYHRSKLQSNIDGEVKSM